MKRSTINKLLVCCAFVSATSVVSFGRHGETDSKKIEDVTNIEQMINFNYMKYPWLKYNNISNNSEQLDVEDNDHNFVASDNEPSTEDIIEEVKDEVVEIIYLGGWTTTTVNVRKEPNATSEILDTYKINTYISYSKYNEKWSVIKYNNDIAYISSKYISETKVPQKSYTEDELYMLSHLIMGEAGGESDKCQLYVGSVVLNRIKSNKYPNTMKGVIFQKGQYSCVRKGGRYYLTPTEQCIKNAKYLLEHGSVLPENVVYQSMFKQGKGVYAIIDGEYFCYY